MSKVNRSGFAGWLVMGLIVAGLAAGGIWYWKHPAEKDPEYKTAPVTIGDMIQTVTATGQLNPVTNVQVGSQVSGIISKLYADFNTPVTNGQLIAQLDPSTYKAVEAQARGELANARAALELAQAEAERSETLYQSKIVAKSDYDRPLRRALALPSSSRLPMIWVKCRLTPWSRKPMSAALKPTRRSTSMWTPTLRGPFMET
jgi:HlyD family secretion protein